MNGLEYAVKGDMVTCLTATSVKKEGRTSRLTAGKSYEITDIRSYDEIPNRHDKPPHVWIVNDKNMNEGYSGKHFQFKPPLDRDIQIDVRELDPKSGGTSGWKRIPASEHQKRKPRNNGE